MKKIIKIFVMIIILITLSGCFNYKEINDYAIVSGISIDKDNEDPSKYVVGIQIMNAKKDEETDTSLITFYKASGKTIYQALEKIMLDSPKELYLGHNEVLVLSEELLKEKDPLSYLDYFMRDAEIEKDALVMVSEGNKAYNILKVITPLETIPSTNLKSTLNIADNFSGTLTIITIDQFISDLKSKGAQPIIPMIKITGDIKKGEKMDNITESDPSTKLKFDSLAYFENNKLKGYLSNDESTGYNFLAKTQKETYVNVKCDDVNEASVRVKSAKIKEKISFKEKIPYVNIDINVNADLLEYNCSADFIKSDKPIKELEKKVAKKIKSLVTKTTNKLYKENTSDVLKYGEKFYGKKYKEMKKLGYSKDDIAKNIQFNFKTKVNIISTKLSINGIKG